MLHEYIPFFYALLAVLGAFVIILIDVMAIEFKTRADNRRLFLRDKMYWAMMQSPKRRKTSW